VSDFLVENPVRNEHSAQERLLKASRPWLTVFAITLIALIMFLAFWGGEGVVLGLITLVGLAACGLIAVFGFLSGVLIADFGGRRRAVEALSHIVENGRTALAITDERGSIRYANDAYRQLISPLAKDRLVSIERLLTGREDAEREGFALMRAAQTGKVWEAEFNLPDEQGEARRFCVRTHPLKGYPRWTCWETADVTAQYDARRRRDSLIVKLTAVLDEAAVGIFASEADGRLSFANATLLRWLGRDKEMIDTGQLKLADLVIGDALSLVAPARDDGKDTDVQVPEAFEAELKTADGRRLPVRILQAFVRNEAGELSSRAIVLARGAERAPEEAMRAAEARFARIFDSAPVGIVVVDEDGKILEANNAFQVLVTGKAMRGGRLLELISAADRNEVETILAAAIAGKAHLGLAEVHLTSDAAAIQMRAGAGDLPEKVVQLYASRIERVHEGKPAALLYLVDATEQKSLEMQFAQSQKMQAVGQLAGGIAHDFNNLLTAIIGFCDLLLVRHQAGDPSFADLIQIKQNANRASNLVRQLLAFSRRQTLRPRVLQLTDVLADLSELLRRLLGEKIALQVVHGRNLFAVKADEGQFEQVIINLAVNARDAMPQGGKLTIRTSNIGEEESRQLGNPLIPVGEYVLCEVGDTGVGISKEVIGRIFEPFFTTKEVGKGTGLGLSTVYGIIKQTGGFIFPASEVGKGTSFRIYLPRYRQESVSGAAADLAAPSLDPARDLSGRGVILLVEDEDAVRSFAVRALESRGYQVLAANSGEAALEEVAGFQGDINLVVSDVVMPGMDGPTLIKKLREQSPTLKVIFISGYAEDAFRRNLPPSEDFAFLPKPFSLKQLAAKVKEIMEAPSRGD
jgi:two-component system cell cycle sensor histidine kinase/response regulator CckA